MGKQISFFMALQDVEDLLSFIAERDDFLLSRTAAPILSVGPELRSEFSEQEFGFQAYIWNYQLKKPNIDKRSGYIEDSEVVEFSSGSCHAESKIIFPGRFYIDMFYMKDNEILKKSGKLIEVYDAYRRYVIRSFKKSINRKRHFYIAPKAYELCQTGWRAMAGELVEILF